MANKVSYPYFDPEDSGGGGGGGDVNITGDSVGLAKDTTLVDTNTKLDTLDASQQLTNTKLDTLDASQQLTNTKLDSIDAKQQTTNDKLDVLDASQQLTNAKLDTLDASQQVTNTKLDTLTTAVDELKDTESITVYDSLGTEYSKNTIYNSDGTIASINISNLDGTVATSQDADTYTAIQPSPVLVHAASEVSVGFNYVAPSGVFTEKLITNGEYAQSGTTFKEQAGSIKDYNNNYSNFNVTPLENPAYVEYSFEAPIINGEYRPDAQVITYDCTAGQTSLVLGFEMYDSVTGVQVFPPLTTGSGTLYAITDAASPDLIIAPLNPGDLNAVTGWHGNLQVTNTTYGTVAFVELFNINGVFNLDNLLTNVTSITDGFQLAACDTGFILSEESVNKSEANIGFFGGRMYGVDIDLSNFDWDIRLGLNVGDAQISVSDVDAVIDLTQVIGTLQDINLNSPMGDPVDIVTYRRLLELLTNNASVVNQPPDPMSISLLGHNLAVQETTADTNARIALQGFNITIGVD